MDTRDSIIIKDLEVFAFHGVMEEERRLGQKFLVSLELFLDLHPAGETDDLEKTLDYAQISHFVSERMAEKPFNLIEAAAEDLAKNLLVKYEKLLEAVRVSIKKPWAPVGLPLDHCGVSIFRKWHRVFIGAGSNMGERERFLESGIRAFEDDPHCRVIKRSEVIETEPYGGVEQEDFLNMVFEVKTMLDPVGVLRLCNEAENRAGRKREIHWGPRTLDLDVLLYDDLILDMEEPDLIIPHPDMHNRTFVLEPLAQIAPRVIHPVLGAPVLRLLEQLEN